MIKGNNPKSKNTVYVNFEDFCEAVKKYKPACLKALAEVAHVNRASAQAFEIECQAHFRNICESVAPEFDSNEELDEGTYNAELGQNITVGLGDNPRQSESSDMGNVDEATTAITMPAITQRPAGKKKKKKKVAAHYLAPTAASKAMKRDKSPNAAKTVKRSPSNPTASLSPSAKTQKRDATSSPKFRT